MLLFLRGMATSIGNMFGKTGALLGNILIGIFIDAHCIVPIFVSSSFLISKYKYGTVINNLSQVFIHLYQWFSTFLTVRTT